MAKKKNFSNEQLDKALEIVHQEYFIQVLSLLSHKKDEKELSYVKVPITTPAGGTYLVSILHVDGPKLDLKELAKKAEGK